MDQKSQFYSNKSNSIIVMISNFRNKRTRQHFSDDSSDGTSSPVSGKWTVREEAYANELIKSFELGILTDCEEGSTLRSYLARKLNCAPMRISKKFAGKGIGKVRYNSKQGSRFL